MRLSAAAALVKCDYDDMRRPPPLGPSLQLLRRAGFKPVWCSWRRSPGGHGWHVVWCVRPRPQTPAEVTALQAILGSDAKREASNLWRARNWSRMSPFWRERWNVLYRKGAA